MAFYREQEADFRARKAMGMATGSPVLWPRRIEAKKRESWKGRAECWERHREDWPRRRVELGFRNRDR